MALDYVTRYIIFPDHDSITILFSKSGIVAIKKKKLVEFMNLLLKIFESIQIGILRIINVKN